MFVCVWVWFGFDFLLYWFTSLLYDGYDGVYLLVSTRVLVVVYLFIFGGWGWAFVSLLLYVEIYVCGWIFCWDVYLLVSGFMLCFVLSVLILVYWDIVGFWFGWGLDNVGLEYFDSYVVVLFNTFWGSFLLILFGFLFILVSLTLTFLLLFLSYLGCISFFGCCR